MRDIMIKPWTCGLSAAFWQKWYTAHLTTSIGSVARHIKLRKITLKTGSCSLERLAFHYHHARRWKNQSINLSTLWAVMIRFKKLTKLSGVSTSKTFHLYPQTPSWIIRNRCSVRHLKKRTSRVSFPTPTPRSSRFCRISLNLIPISDWLRQNA